jgi:integrase
MAIRNGVIKINPYDTFRVGFKPVDRDYLDKEEIEKLANLEIDDQRLALYRDFFLFACYTGLAYSDIQQFKREHIKLDTDGTYYIKKPRQKTGGVSIIPLLDPAIRILIKYSLTGDPRDFIWHVVCNQVLNRHLKKIARMAKIDKQLFMHLARHTFATTVTLSNGVPLETVSKMLGHTSLKHTVRYARVVAEKIKNDMGRVRGVFK